MTLISTVLRLWIDTEGHKILTASIVLGVDETTVCHWMAGRTIPRLNSLKRLALAMCASGLEMSYAQAVEQLNELAEFDRQHPHRRIRPY